MSAGLAALLDDVAVLARAAAASVDDVGVAAAKAGAKAAGVVIDDTAVTPQYVRGLAAEREIPIVRRIALGSLRNKFLIILPVILLLSEFLPWALTPLLMIGGAYLCYEGAEKVWERIAHHDDHAAQEQQPDEKTLIAGAIRTDLILSAEIMVISLNEVANEDFVSRLVILSVVAVIMTLLVYGVVGLIVKMDDVGLKLAEGSSKGAAKLGRGLVKAMPKVLTGLTVIGTAAMLWVGGHILLVGMHDLGVHFLYDFVHHIEEDAHHATGAVGGVVGWLVNTVASAILGLVVGAIIVAFMSVTFHRKKSHGEGEAGHEKPAAIEKEPKPATETDAAASDPADAAGAKAAEAAEAESKPEATTAETAPQVEGEPHVTAVTAPAAESRPQATTGTAPDAQGKPQATAGTAPEAEAESKPHVTAGTAAEDRSEDVTAGTTAGPQAGSEPDATSKAAPGAVKSTETPGQDGAAPAR